MPSATTKIQTLREQTDEGEIPYLSKSRVKTWETCPRQFYHTYIEGRRPEETDAMRQGTRVHEVFEDYYANVQEHFEQREGGEIPEFPPTPEQLSNLLPDDVLRWADWRKFMANFLVWEISRAEQALEVVEDLDWPMDNSTKIVEAINHWIPVGIEEEAWREGGESKEPPWMGFADVIVHAASVSEIESDTGVVIVDFKTGKTPKKKYRNDGIFLEGEYYGMIFEDEYDVAGVAGYYPKNGDFLVSELSEERRDHVRKIISEINEAVDSGSNVEDFPIDEQPLCMWGCGEGEACDFYDDCPSNWGIPAEKEELFKQMIENGNSAYQIADYMDCEMNHVYYWARKLNLDL